MKKIWFAGLCMVGIIFVIVMVGRIGVANTLASEENKSSAYPYVITHEVGTSGFANGDGIEITSVRGDRNQIEPGGTYLVEGNYTLSTVTNAMLALSLTSKGPSAPSAWTSEQRMTVKQGSGTFSLKEKMPYDGHFHVSFYASGERHSHGGVYFGERGNEKTMLRDFDWSVVTGVAK